MKDYLKMLKALIFVFFGGTDRSNRIISQKENGRTIA